MRDRDNSPEREPNDGREQGRSDDRDRNVEDKYLDRLGGERDGNEQRRVDAQVERLVGVVGPSPGEVREAWHLWRAKDPQPETHHQLDAMQLRLSEDKNLAFATLLVRAGVEGERAPAAPAARQPSDDDANPFADAARGAGFRRVDGNPGDRPSFPPLAERERPDEPAPLMRGAVSPLERQVIQAAALEAVARGAIAAARERDVERPESRAEYYARKRTELDDAQVKSVERDVEKLRKVPGLGDASTAEREFDKADNRYRDATTDDERAKAFTRAAALSVLIEGLRREGRAPMGASRPLPDPSEPRPAREISNEPPVVQPLRLPRDEPAREQPKTEPERKPSDEERTEPDQNPARERDTEPARPRVLPLDVEDERANSVRDFDAPTAPEPQRSTPSTDPDPREIGTAPARLRSQPQDRPVEQGTDERESPPIQKRGLEGLLIPAHRLDVDERQIVEERSVTYSRNVDRDAFSLRDRDRQNSEDERLGAAVAHEVYVAQDFRDADHIQEQVREAAAAFRLDPENADWRECARKHEVLADQATREDDNEVNLPQRIALAELALERLTAHHRLVHRVTQDNLDELRAAPPWERDAMKQEAQVLLDIEGRPGDRPFEDWAFVGRELTRVSDQGDDAVRVLAVINAFNRHASPSLLAEEARWNPEKAQSVYEQGEALLTQNAQSVDARLATELVQLRMSIILDPDEAVRVAARSRAEEVALLLEDLPARRSRELPTT